ncbi:MAG: winged helix-turn-helix transcriptional regulator [Peptococcaceae bacterium]|nr:winged helix-turn-helix transcriptional regulator [Peptococcaceae bacterium]
MKEQMGMMGGMMGGMNPMEMCKYMTESVAKAAEMGSYATPEVRALFEDWVEEVEKEILTLIKSKGEVQTSDIAEKLKINEGSVIFFISRLAQKGKIKIKALL